MTRRWVYVCALAASWTLGAGVEADATPSKADSLFQTAMAQVGRMPVKESLKAFEYVLKADWNYAPAHFEMAKLYMSLNTPEDRQHARHALDEAIHLDPKNVTYQLTQGSKVMGQAPAGVYNLTVKVKDVRTGRTVERETLFRVVE